MSGQQFHDVLAMKTLVKGQRNGVRIGSDQTGKLWKSVLGNAYEPLVPDPASFAEQTLRIAQNRMPDLGLDRVSGSDFDGMATDNVAAGFGWVNPSVFNTTYSGGVYALNNSAVFLNNKNPLIVHPRGEPWFARVRVRFNGTTFAGGGFDQFITLANAAATHVIELINNGASTQLGITMIDSAGSSGFISGGSDFVLGSTNFPNNAWTTLSLWFRPGDTMHWEAADVVNPANVLTQTQLDHLTDEPMVVYGGSLDGGNALIDAIALAYHSAL